MRVSAEQFEQQCKRRFGTANPERMRVQHWEWMVRRGGSAYSARQEIVPNTFTHGEPDWCFDRFGMSHTPMPDGRIICVAGEHEDFYDPDFCIYNDVIVLRPASGADVVTFESGEVEIYGYPEGIFPPTDFHTATLVDKTIFLIGRLGYYGKRQADATPVMTLDTYGYRISTAKTVDAGPGWIYRHHASYNATRHTITVRGGAIYTEGAKAETPNPAVFRLHLADMRWECLALTEKHEHFIISQEEGTRCDLDELPANAFRPRTVPYTWLPPAGLDAIAYGLDVEEVRVEFRPSYASVKVYVEGELPSDLVDQLLFEIIENLCAVTGCEWQLSHAQKSID